MQGYVFQLPLPLFSRLAVTTLLFVSSGIFPTSAASRQNQVPMVRTPFTNCAVWLFACLSLLFSPCHCIFYSPYQHLPLASFKSFNGTFGFPSGGTQIFDEGTEMTIRWSTDFAAVNLYVVCNASSIPPSPGLQKQLSSKHSKVAIHSVYLLTHDQPATQTRHSIGP